MRVVHFSTNSLAGMPLRLVRGLNGHTPHQARLVDLERYSLDKLGWYEHDVVFAEQPDEAVRLAQEADVLHLHNYLDLDSQDFAPIDFRRLRARGKLVVRQFHSIPQVVAARMDAPLTRVLGCELPAMVIGHYPERYFPRALVVPNFVPQDDPAYRPPGREQRPEVDLFFSPTKLTGAWENRWNTKGAPETEALMRRLARDTGCTWELVHGRPLAEVLRLKRLARIVLDDMSNGSMHLSGLEGVSQGKPVCAYLDERQLRVLAALCGTGTHPFVNVRLEEAGTVLRHLLAHPDEAREMGLDARAWLERHFADHLLVGHFERAYAELEHTGELHRQPELRLDGPLARFQAVDLPELRWKARAGRCGGRN